MIWRILAQLAGFGILCSFCIVCQEFVEFFAVASLIWATTVFVKYVELVTGIVTKGWGLHLCVDVRHCQSLDD